MLNKEFVSVMSELNVFENTPDPTLSADFNAALELAHEANKAFDGRRTAALALAGTFSLESELAIDEVEADFANHNKDFHLFSAAADSLMPARAAYDKFEAAQEARNGVPELKEVLHDQIGTAFAGYTSLVEQINKNRSKADKIEPGDQETLVAELEEWLSIDKLSYLATAEEADPELTFTLCAVPNETVTPDEIIEDARDFGKKQPYKTTVYPEVITQYTPEEVSGTNPANSKKFKFVAVPSKFTPEMYGTVNALQDKLAELQKDAPFLEAPTPLVGMSFLHTRRAMGDKLVGAGTANKTYMRSYGMEDKPFGRDRYVPYLVVFDFGKLVVSYSYVRYDDDGFALVG